MSGGRRKKQERRSNPTRSPGAAPKSVLNWVPPPGVPGSFGQALIAGRALWVTLALFAMTQVVYASLISHEFLGWGDTEYIFDNPAVVHGLTWSGVLQAFTTPYFFNWHPLTTLSYMLDVQLYGLNAGPHHLTNLVFHSANTLLLFCIFHRLTGALGRSAFLAAFFAVHPLHVESVAWVSERKDVLSTLFWMLSLAAYARYAQRPGASRYLTVVLLFALGVMAKPMVVSLPFVLLLMDYWPLRRISLETRDWWGTSWRLVREKLPLLGLAFVSSIITVMAQRQGGAVVGLDALPWNLRLQNVAVCYVVYLSKTFWPTHLAAFYPYPRSLSAWQVASALVILIGISVWVIHAARRSPYLPVGWLWYLGTLTPVIGLVQVGSQAIADRYTYVPLIGIFLMAVWEAAARFGAGRYSLGLLAVGGGLAVAACMFIAWRQVHYWQDDLSLWTHDLQVTTENYAAHYNLGVALSQRGRLRDAILQEAEAVRIKPSLGGAHLRLAADLAAIGRTEEAIEHYTEALRINPNLPEAHNNLGAILAGQGKIAEAMAQYNEAIRIKPDYADPHYNLGAALKDQGKLAEAQREFQEALRINPNLGEARLMLEELNRPPRQQP